MRSSFLQHQLFRQKHGQIQSSQICWCTLLFWNLAILDSKNVNHKKHRHDNFANIVFHHLRKHDTLGLFKVHYVLELEKVKAHQI